MIKINYLLLLTMVINLSISKMPKGYDSKLWCNSCQAITRELLIMLRGSKSEMNVK